MKSKAKPEISPVMQKVSAYIAAAPRKALPAKVLEKTKHHVLDTLAAMVSGSRLLPKPSRMPKRWAAKQRP